MLGQNFKGLPGCILRPSHDIGAGAPALALPFQELGDLGHRAVRGVEDPPPAGVIAEPENRRQHHGRGYAQPDAGEQDRIEGVGSQLEVGIAQGLIADAQQQGDADGENLAIIQQARGDDLQPRHGREAGQEDHRRAHDAFRQDFPEQDGLGHEREQRHDAGQPKGHMTAGAAGGGGEADRAAAGGDRHAIQKRGGDVGETFRHDALSHTRHVRPFPVRVVEPVRGRDAAKTVQGQEHACQNHGGQIMDIEIPADRQRAGREKQRCIIQQFPGGVGNGVQVEAGAHAGAEADESREQAQIA